MTLAEAETIVGRAQCVCPEGQPSALCEQHAHLLEGGE